MDNTNSVGHIRHIGLCCGCGACVGACKRQAISMTRNVAGYIVPKIDEAKCCNCGICLRTCPSFRGNKPMSSSKDPFIGDALEGYIGYAQNAQYRAGGQSGGVVSAIIRHLLKRGLIDGAIVNVFNKSINRNVPELITNVDELPRSFGSYYAQSSVVELFLKHKEKRLAIVALGCQTQALKLFLRNVSSTKPDVFIIGLFCAGNYSGDYIDDLIHASHIEPKAVDEFRFRYKDIDEVAWPGKVMVASQGRHILLPSHRRTLVKRLYEVPRCRFCYDQLNVFADVSIGDPWGIGREDNRRGNSVFIARTKRGQDIIQSAMLAGEIVATSCKVEDIVAGQTVNTRLKRDLCAAVTVANDLNIEVPYVPSFAFDPYYTKDVKSHIRARVLFSLRQMTLTDRDVILHERESLRRSVTSEYNRKKILHVPRRIIGWLVSQLRRVK